MGSDSSFFDSYDPDDADHNSPDDYDSEFTADQSRDDAFDDELEDALARNDYISLSRLAFERAVHFHRLQLYSIAVEYSDLALDAWRVHFDRRPDDVLTLARSTELRMVNAAATQHFNQNHFNATIDLIHQARRLAALMPPTILTADIEWNTALMERWRRDFPKALQHALRVIKIYRENDASPLEIARTHLFVAQIADDCAASSAAQGATQLVDRYLNVAKHHLNCMRPPTDSPQSPAVEGHYRLIYSAYSRLMGRNENRLGMLESIIPVAQALNDRIFEGQIYTALADEYSFLGSAEQARTCYAFASDTLLSSESPSLALWPLRPLKQEWEYGLDRFAGALW
jgi:hypothetical protein